MQFTINNLDCTAFHRAAKADVTVGCYHFYKEINMLNIQKTKNGTDFAIALEGRLDTTTAPQLEKELKDDIAGVTELSFDFEKLEYISSAGLRVLLSAQKIMNKQGHMGIRNVNEDIMEIFEVTGFSDILDIE